MKDFIVKTASFLLILCLLYLLVSYIAGKNHEIKNDYTAAIIVKDTRLDSISRPKIVFQGGSNTAFGIDCAMVERELRMPAVNLGLHASFGVNFMLEELKSGIKKNDIIILSFEYFLSSDGDYKIKKLAGIFYPPARKYYRKNIFKEINYTHYIIKESLLSMLREEYVDDVFNRKSFDEYGDIVAHLVKKDTSNFYGNGAEMKYGKWDAIPALNNFCEFAQNIGAQVYYVFPYYPENEYKRNEKTIQLLYEDLKKNLKIKMLNQPSEAVLGNEFFYDAVYHLNERGKEIRTTRLIEILKQDKDVQLSRH
jgi:hypothetical protein